MSNNEKTGHLINILSDLIDGKKLASIDIKASNSNQYFCTIKNNGIELIEVNKPNLTNRGHHLERRLNLSDENVQKAEDYLNKLKGIKDDEKRGGIMKLLDFEADSKKYCLLKQDNYNFCVLEYLPTPKETIVNGTISVNEFKPPFQYYGTLEYAIRKAFRVLGKDYIPKEKFSLFCPSNDALKSIFELKPYEVNSDNVAEVRELIKKATGLNELEETLVS